MMRPARVGHARERLDMPVHDAGVLADSLRDLAAVNRWLGGTRAVLRTLRAVLPAGGSLLDVGTGGGDIPRALVRRARRRGESIRVVGCDLHEQTVALAAAWSRSFDEIRIVRGDALALPFADGAFDVVLLSLTFHHFDDDAQISTLRELARVARRAIVVNDLERSWPNYLGARLLAATLWRGNELTRHDGPLSVLRGFTRDELIGRARTAGLRDPRVERRFFYRIVLSADARPPAAAATA
jgi:SAM-dependent methyltransferase